MSRGDNVLAFVNGMGGTPLIELYVAFNSVDRILGGQGISIERSLVGNYITSLEMAGFSVTLLRLDDELTRLVGRPGPHGRPALARLAPAREPVSLAAVAPILPPGRRPHSPHD